MTKSHLDEKKEVVVQSLRAFGTSVFTEMTNLANANGAVNLSQRFQVFVPEGTYYALVDIRSLGFEDDVAFCRMLPEKAGVAAIPCSAFYFSNSPARHLVRFAFCKNDETLHEALRRLKKWKTSLTG